MCESRKLVKTIRKIIVSDIDWDAPKDVGLPAEVTIVIGNENKHLLNDINGYSDEVADYLSDVYGFCVFGFCISFE